MGTDTPTALEAQVIHRLLFTAKALTQAIGGLLREHGLSATRYNALRILRGAQPDGLTCGEIRERMMTPVPDVTRLVDRLERSALVERHRDSEDRRIVRVEISELGLHTIAPLDALVAERERDLLGGLGKKRLEELGRLLEAAQKQLT